MPQPQETIHLLLADDDLDDRFFFNDVLSELPVLTRLTAIDDGERLISYLSENSKQLPDVLFLDLNMPRKNGFECLTEIKLNNKLQQLPVIIYSTSLHEAVADELYKNGAHYFMRKAGINELKNGLQQVITMLVEKKILRPSRDKFVLNLGEE